MNQRSDRFAEQLAQLSDEQLVASFNAEVGNRGWTSARSEFLSALRMELISRPLDVSAVVRDDGLTLKHKVKINELNQIVAIDAQHG